MKSLNFLDLQNIKEREVILEIAHVQYENEFDYDFTIFSQYFIVDSYKEAILLIYEDLQENCEYYIYKSIEDLKEGNSYKFFSVTGEKEDFFKYLELNELIADYIKFNNLDIYDDRKEILNHFKPLIDEELFRYNCACLIPYEEYRIKKLKKLLDEEMRRC